MSGTVSSSASLRVALDLAHLRLARAGVARYALGLAEALDGRPDVEVVRLGLGERAFGTRKRLLALRQDLTWYPTQSRAAARRAGAAVHHAPALRGPLTRGTPPLVVTVHDLVALTHPETLSTWNRLYSRATLRRLLAAADRIICVSEASADDVTRLVGVEPERIRVIPNAVDSRFTDEPPEVPPVDPPYVLFVGTPEPRKNLPRLFEAMRRRRAAGAPERLVLAGGNGWGDVKLGHGLVLGAVNDHVLHALYAHAACLVLPSLHEGFGIPVVEAMAAGCPVVASRVGGLPEVCGDAGVLVDPYDPDDIARGIDEAIARADELRALGQARARTFSWDAVAEATVAVYREVA